MFKFPYKRDAHARPIERKVKAKCTFDGFLKTCLGDIYGNADPTKIITCGNCVQFLLSIPREEKIKIRDLFISRDLTEQARSIQSFIVEEETDGELRATFKREGIGKVTRNVNRRIGRVSKARLPVGEDRKKSLLL